MTAITWAQTAVKHSALQVWLSMREKLICYFICAIHYCPPSEQWQKHGCQRSSLYFYLLVSIESQIQEALKDWCYETIVIKHKAVSKVNSVLIDIFTLFICHLIESFATTEASSAKDSDGNIRRRRFGRSRCDDTEQKRRAGVKKF